MNSIIAFVLNHSGANKVWEFLDGKKVILASGLGILTSLTGLASELAPIIAGHNTVALIGWIGQLSIDPSWQGFILALGILGIGHRVQKAADAAATSAPAPVVPPAA